VFTETEKGKIKKERLPSPCTRQTSTCICSLRRSSNSCAHIMCIRTYKWHWRNRWEKNLHAKN